MPGEWRQLIDLIFDRFVLNELKKKERKFRLEQTGFLAKILKCQRCFETIDTPSLVGSPLNIGVWAWGTAHANTGKTEQKNQFLKITSVKSRKFTLLKMC